MDSSYPHAFREPLGTLKCVTGDVGVSKGPKKDGLEGTSRIRDSMQPYTFCNKTYIKHISLGLIATQLMMAPTHGANYLLFCIIFQPFFSLNIVSSLVPIAAEALSSSFASRTFSEGPGLQILVVLNTCEHMLIQLDSHNSPPGVVGL